MRGSNLDVRTVFLSDAHIGYHGSDLWSLLDFLRHVRCRYLFLNGDIVDSWKLEERWHWPEAATQIFRELALKHLMGTKVIFLPGNHDDLFRRIDPWTRKDWARKMGFSIQNTHMHKTADGKRWLVLHGDQFDAGILRAGLSRWSDKAWVEIANVLPIRMSKTPGGQAFSLARELAKRASKKALSMLNRFEKAAVRRARLRGADGIICGHTHLPIIKTIGGGVLYANSGMWQGLGKNTALVEDWDGQLRLIHWDMVEEKTVRVCEAPRALQERSDRLAHQLRRWTERAVRASLKLEESRRVLGKMWTKTGL